MQDFRKSNDNGIVIHNGDDLVSMRKAGKLAAEVLDYIGDMVMPGVSTGRLNDLCHEMILDSGAIPAPLHYNGFPKSICTSVNHVVCHGIPDNAKILKNGDIVNIDVTVIVDGWHGDTSRMYCVGDKISVKARKLIDCTYESMMRAIAVIKPGVELNTLGAVIQEYAESNNLSVVRDYCGHGIGKVFHAAPNVLHYESKLNKVVLQEGMFFTVEPMLNCGKHGTKVLNDGWTVVTRDKSLSAQFEHTVAVVKGGVEILTQSSKKGEW